MKLIMDIVQNYYQYKIINNLEYQTIQVQVITLKFYQLHMNI